MITIFLVVLWLANGAADGGPALVEHQIIPEGVTCPDFALAFLAARVTGNPNYSDVTWACFDVPKTPEKAA